MIQLKTILHCIDNSGAALVECITLLKRKRPAQIGDRIVVVVQKERSILADPKRAGGALAAGGASGNLSANKVRRGDMRHAVIVRQKKEWRRLDGSYTRCDDNACVLINKTGDPIGTRLNGLVASDLRNKGWSKIMTLAPATI